MSNKPSPLHYARTCKRGNILHMGTSDKEFNAWYDEERDLFVIRVKKKSGIYYSNNFPDKKSFSEALLRIGSNWEISDLGRASIL